MNGNGRGGDEGADARRYWDAAAATFDDEPDHGLRDRQVLDAWAALLAGWLPAERAAILDAGCGTGSLSLLLARQGHAVTGIDFAPAMVDRAIAKAAGVPNAPRFILMDVATPDFPPASFDVVVCRHVLWALSELERVLSRWTGLLRSGGRLILIEGFWSTGAGLHAEDLAAALPARLSEVAVFDLSDRPALWGKDVTDERYAVIADLP